ncbi:prepilin-type N-terminal cleavage/methylation domain-containing protein [bacterium]|nr:prepilin-type N-terminal cleavage/methylation domain-containing protein [bacterium]
MTSKNNLVHTLYRGMSVIEVLVTLALIGIILSMATGLLGMARRNQKTLLYTARQISFDVREAVEISKSRSEKFAVQVKSDGYTIYVEDDDPADGWQAGEEVIETRTFATDVVLTDPTSIPDDWKRRIYINGTEELRLPTIIKNTDIFFIDASGLEEQRVMGLNFPNAPVYQTVCVRVYDSGDSDVYRYSEEGKTWTLAPLG